MKRNKPTTTTLNTQSSNSLYEAFAAIQSKDEAQRFLEDLCTPNELQALIDRWLTVNLIKEGHSYRTINEQTGISVTTVGRVARCVMLGSNGYNLIYERLNQAETNEISFQINHSDTKERAVE